MRYATGNFSAHKFIIPIPRLSGLSDTKVFGRACSTLNRLSLSIEGPDAEGGIHTRRSALPAGEPVLLRHSSALHAIALFVLQERSLQAERVARSTHAGDIANLPPRPPQAG